MAITVLQIRAQRLIRGVAKPARFTCIGTNKSSFINARVQVNHTLAQIFSTL